MVLNQNIYKISGFQSSNFNFKSSKYFKWAFFSSSGINNHSISRIRFLINLNSRKDSSFSFMYFSASSYVVNGIEQTFLSSVSLRFNVSFSSIKFLLAILFLLVSLSRLSSKPNFVTKVLKLIIVK